MTKLTSRCPVCDGTTTHAFLRREDVPVHQHLILSSSEEASEVVRGELALAVCCECGFVFNAAFDDSKLSYGADYDNTQSFSPYFSHYMGDLARHLLDKEGVRDCQIVEVGCGKGVFLRSLVADARYGNTGIGFDPTYVGTDIEMDGRLRFERRFYDGDCANIPADIVICRHVIEHISQPLELLRSVRLALRHAKSPKIYFETPCVEWILRNQVIWDFFYEHCSLFTANSLRTAFEKAGFMVHSVSHVFGGQYLWLEAGIAEVTHVSRDAGEVVALGKSFSEKEKRLRDVWRSRIEELRAAGPIAVWGAGAKGTTFVHQIDPDCNLIKCLVDLNPNKQGTFAPITGHPIISPGELAAHGVHTAILMNTNYRKEIDIIISDLGLTVNIIE